MKAQIPVDFRTKCPPYEAERLRMWENFDTMPDEIPKALSAVIATAWHLADELASANDRIKLLESRIEKLEKRQNAFPAPPIGKTVDPNVVQGTLPPNAP